MKKIIIIEGIDGCGKDFVRDSIKNILNNDDVKFLREPDGYFREILKDKNIEKSFMDEFISMWIGRFVLWIEEILKSPLSFFVINRSYPSTYAYQIQGRGLSDFEKSFNFWKERLLLMFKDEDIQIHHLYLKTDVSVSLSRTKKRANSDGLEYFEEENFLIKTKDGYDDYYTNMNNFTKNEFIHIIDANKTKDEVMSQVKMVLNI